MRIVGLAVVVMLASGGLAATVQAARTQSRKSSLSADCAHLKVRAKPKLNTAMTPEIITSRVTNCSSAKEQVTLAQTITPSAPAKSWHITLAPGESVTRTRSVPYVCCDSYTVTDVVRTASGKELAKGTAGFTFA